MLAEFLQLNPVEQELLRFAMHLRSEGAMRDLFWLLAEIGFAKNGGDHGGFTEAAEKSDSICLKERQ